MNEKEILESGLLELYALGALDPKEEQEVGSWIERSELVRLEYDTIVDALEKYGDAQAKPAPAHVLKQVKIELGIESDNSHVEASSTKEVSMNGYRVWAVAASVLLVCSIIFNWFQRTELSQLSMAYDQLKSEQDQVIAHTATLKAQSEEQENLLDILSKQETVNVKLGGTEKYPNFSSRVYWDSEAGEIVVSSGKVGELGNDEQYQLWALVDGKPVDLGVFDSTDQMKKMKVLTANNAQAFAVTIEPKGGSISPTLAKMCLYGEVAI
jgi:anti-sigma-K factor RskA